tara:strand:- start:1452 stop:1910 length:459 start_codon:yes stop_codon:yes gene_type:complete
MIRKIKIFILLSFFLYGCDYKPIYSDKSNNSFSIEQVDFLGDVEINNLISKKLKRYQNKNVAKKFNIEINSVYDKISQSKDRTGKTTDYKVIVEVTFKIDDNENITTLQIKEDFLIKNLTNEFEERKYEKTKVENATDIIINTFIIQLSQIK